MADLFVVAHSRLSNRALSLTPSDYAQGGMFVRSARKTFIRIEQNNIHGIKVSQKKMILKTTSLLTTIVPIIVKASKTNIFDYKYTLL